VRHIKVQGCRSPFDGDWSYWAKRAANTLKVTLSNYFQVAEATKRNAKECGLHFQVTWMEVHHLDGNQSQQMGGGTWLYFTNIANDQVHQGMHDKHQVTRF